MKKQIFISDIEFDIHDGPIGISASGGADSSLLLYILMKHGSGPIHVFTCASKEKHRVAPVIASNIIGQCIDMTEFSHQVYHHVYFVEKQTYNTLFDGLKTICEPLDLPIIYTAATANPPATAFENSDNGLSSKRDPSTVRPFYYPFVKNTNLYTPMFNVDKSKVKQLYDELQLTDNLFPITRSCESLTLKSGHCGECWWCKERQWAFGRLQ